ncbi:MAG: DUF4339 domain-containing protein [Bdellovibrionales bacterium]|nr:DUF4339 domain-containing protein [Bdellovibrionales bacterium]
MSSRSPVEWFIENSANSGATEGPYSAEKIVEWVQTGKIKNTDRVTAEWLAGEWISASDLVAGYKAAYGSPEPSVAPASSAAATSVQAQPNPTVSEPVFAPAPAPAPSPPTSATTAPEPMISPPAPTPVVATPEPQPTSAPKPAPTSLSPLSLPSRPGELTQSNSEPSLGTSIPSTDEDPAIRLFEIIQALKYKRGASATAVPPPLAVTEEEENAASLWKTVQAIPKPVLNMGLAIAGGVFLLIIVVKLMGSSSTPTKPETTTETPPAAVAPKRDVVNNPPAGGDRFRNLRVDPGNAPAHRGAMQPAHPTSNAAPAHSGSQYDHREREYREREQREREIEREREIREKEQRERELMQPMHEAPVNSASDSDKPSNDGAQPANADHDNQAAPAPDLNLDGVRQDPNRKDN